MTGPLMVLADGTLLFPAGFAALTVDALNDTMEAAAKMEARAIFLIMVRFLSMSVDG